MIGIEDSSLLDLRRTLYEIGMTSETEERERLVRDIAAQLGA